MNLAQAIDTFEHVYGRLPGRLVELTEPCARTSYPFIQRIHPDPWDCAYEYVVLGERRYELRSNGEDGLPDTEDDLRWPESKGE